MLTCSAAPTCGDGDGDRAASSAAGSVMSDDDWELLSEQERASGAGGEDAASDVGGEELEEGDREEEEEERAAGGFNGVPRTAPEGRVALRVDDAVLDDDGTVVTVADRAALAAFVDDAASVDDGDDEVRPAQRCGPRAHRRSLDGGGPNRC